MEKKDLPIGVYDSGVGGISVLEQTVRLLPHEDFIYFGDSANAPYGSKDEETIRRLSLACGDFLYRKGVKMVVIACNTATSIVVKTMREKYNIPIVSIEPAVKPAAEQHGTGDIVVLATPATLRQRRYHELTERLGIGDRLVNVSCEALAELIERGDPESPHIKAYLYEKLLPLRTREEVGALVIGCTHYSFISDQIKDVAHKLLKGPCEIYDGRYGTARHIAEVLKKQGLAAERQRAGKIDFFSSGGEPAVRLLERFFQI